MLNELKRQPRGSIDWPEGKKPRVIKPEDLTETHIRIFRILHPIIGHRFLPKPWILAHFSERNADNFSHELRDLMRKPNQYIFWPEQQSYTLNAGYKPAVYGLTHKGAEQLELPLPKLRHPEYAHDLNASLVECSLKFGARDNGITFTMADPQRYEIDGVEWEPDCHPIVIGNKFIPGIEVERRYKGAAPKKTNEKMDKIVLFMKSRHYETLGQHNALIPIISTTTARTEELKQKLADRVGKCEWALFKTIPDWARERHFPDPNGNILTEPFERVGYPPLSLLQDLKGGD